MRGHRLARPGGHRPNGGAPWWPALLGLLVLLLAVRAPQRALAAARTAMAPDPPRLEVTGTRTADALTVVLAPDVSGSMVGSDRYATLVGWLGPQLEFFAGEPGFQPKPGTSDMLVWLPWSDRVAAPVMSPGWTALDAAMSAPSAVDNGGTSLLPVLVAADGLVPNGERGVVVLFTDGEIDDDPHAVEAELDRLAARDVQVHVVGIGDGIWSASSAPWSSDSIASRGANTATSLAAILAAEAGLTWTGS